MIDENLIYFATDDECREIGQLIEKLKNEIVKLQTRIVELENEVANLRAKNI